MKAVIIYDEDAYARKAKDMFERAAYHAEIGCSAVTLWRLDMLNLPPIAEMAAADSADAHIMLFALRNPRSLPTWLRDWLGGWAANRLVADAALAVWDGRDDAFATAAAAPELGRFAERHGLTFIWGQESPTEDKIQEFPRFEARHRVAPSHSEALTLNFRYGINE